LVGLGVGLGKVHGLGLQRLRGLGLQLYALLPLSMRRASTLSRSYGVAGREGEGRACKEVCAVSRSCFVLCTVCELGHCWAYRCSGNGTVGAAAEVEESGQDMCTCPVPALLGWQCALFANLRKAKNAATEVFGINARMF